MVTIAALAVAAMAVAGLVLAIVLLAKEVQRRGDALIAKSLADLNNSTTHGAFEVIVPRPAPPSDPTVYGD